MPPTTNTTLGPIVGRTLLTPDLHFVDAYLGVPFAAPPLGPLRFAADFLRIDPTAGVGGDQRYAGLTPAQYTIVPLVLLSIYALVKWRASGELLTPDPNPPEPQATPEKSPTGSKKGKKKKKKR